MSCLKLISGNHFAEVDDKYCTHKRPFDFTIKRREKYLLFECLFVGQPNSTLKAPTNG